MTMMAKKGQSLVGTNNKMQMAGFRRRMRSAKAIRLAMAPLCNELRAQWKGDQYLRNAAFELEDAHHTLAGQPPRKLTQWR